jgi:hypothetical protein
MKITGFDFSLWLGSLSVKIGTTSIFCKFILNQKYLMKSIWLSGKSLIRFSTFNNKIWIRLHAWRIHIWFEEIIFDIRISGVYYTATLISKKQTIYKKFDIFLHKKTCWRGKFWFLPGLWSFKGGIKFVIALNH